MAGTPSDNTVITKFYHALNTPIQYRCGELTVLFDRSNPKDLQNVYPVLIENIFGSSCSIGWGLRAMTPDSHPKEFEILHHFFSPQGPLFKLIYKLLGESHLRYDYPLNQIPLKIRSNLENGRIPPFYEDLLNYESQTRHLLSLKLNPFDYYIMHFAWHLVNPWQQRYGKPTTMNTFVSWNTVYYMLSCDYLLHFLPTDPNCPVLPQVPAHFTGKNPIVTPLQTSNRSSRASKLFRPQVLEQATVEITSLHQTVEQHPRSEIWRSESIVQVFIDLWLHNDQLSQTTNTPFTQSKVSEIPSGEYIRIIRVMVKQLHAFSSSSKNDLTSMGELKKVVMPTFQGKLYAFLRHLIHRWPLDGSFRLVLELWLSFIQPWRYPGDQHLKRAQTHIESEDPTAIPSKAVDREYMNFMANNLLAYTVIFQQLLPRFLRIDLASPKNAVMLYRVSKVFAQPNLVMMLTEIEQCIDNMNHSPSHTYAGIWTSNLPPLSPTSNWSTNRSNVNENHTISQNNSPMKRDLIGMDQNLKDTPSIPKNGKWTGIVRQNIFDLEGPEFYYKPLFTMRPVEEIIQLMRCIQQADMVARELLNQREHELRSQNQGIAGFFRVLFSVAEEKGDEFTLEERKKVPVYLDLAQQNFVEIFHLDVAVCNNNEQTLDGTIGSNIDLTNGASIPTFLNNSMSPKLVQKRGHSIRYQGDPDLEPVKSWESEFLVRILHQITLKINKTYKEEIASLYERNDFCGRVSRQLIRGPIIIKKYEKPIPGVSMLVERALQPRISLRYFASHKFVFYLVVGLSLTRYFGYSFIAFFFTVVLIWVSILFTKALVTDNSVNDRFVPSQADIDEIERMDVSF